MDHNLKNVQAATNAALGRQIQIPVVAVPDEFKRDKTRAVIKEAIAEIGFGHIDNLQLLEYKNAAYHAYDLGNPEALGLEYCDWDSAMYEAVIVDYNAAYLALYLIDLREHRGFRRAHASFPELGENAVRDERLAVLPLHLSKSAITDSVIAKYDK